MSNNTVNMPLCSKGTEFLQVCNQYPVRKLIQVGDRIEVIYLYKIPEP